MKNGFFYCLKDIEVYCRQAMANFRCQGKIERMYYKHGMFMSSHPIVMIIISAIIILCCCYPLLNLPLPGSEPTEFHTLSADFVDEEYVVGKNLPYDNSPNNVELPDWFESNQQVAYVQQFLVKSVVHPWNENEMAVGEAVRAPLAKLFTILEEIENFHLEEDENHSVMKECYQVSESIIKPGNRIKHLFPQYGCFLMSPALFWRRNAQNFRSDPNILHTIHNYNHKGIKTSPSTKDLLFGVPSKETGVNNFMVRNRQRMITYAITLVLKEYDDRLISGLREKLSTLYPTKFAHLCKNRSNCENSSDSGGPLKKDDPYITHIHFKEQIGSNDLIPLLSTYFIMGCYIYFSVRKINFVKSKLGMAFSAVISIVASLMMSVGLCSFFGLKPTLNGGEIFPYLVMIIGLENILVVTKSVVATPINLDVEKRMALGLSREGCSITKNLLLELILIGLGYFSYVPEIQEFCAFAVVGILTDYFMHMVFFTSVLAIDIRRLDVSEDMYTQSYDSDSESDHVDYCKPINNGGDLNGVKPGKKRSVLEQLRASRTRRQRKNSDEIHKVETGGKRVVILKIPKRLRVLFFWADTRMFQRGLMVCMVIWCAILMSPLGDRTPKPALTSSREFKFSTVPPSPGPTKVPFHLFSKKEEVVTKLPLNSDGSLIWHKNDLQSYRTLSFRHWPTLFAYYNITLAGRFVSILPTIPLTVHINPADVVKDRSNYDGSRKHDPSVPDALQHEENFGQQLPPYYTPMTGLDYYLTLLVGAVSGMLMVFFLTFMYKCICSRNYANWRADDKKHRRFKYKSSCGDMIPLVLSGHLQVVDCVICDDNLLASTDLSGEIRVWDIHTGTCNCIIRRVNCYSQRSNLSITAETAPLPIGYQENDEMSLVQKVSSQNGRHVPLKFWHDNQQSQEINIRHTSGINIPTSNFPHHLEAKSLTPSFSPGSTHSFNINTDFASQPNNKQLVRRRATSYSCTSLGGEEEYDCGSAGYDFDGLLQEYYKNKVLPNSGSSSLGNLAQYFHMDTAFGSPISWQKSQASINSVKHFNLGAFQHSLQTNSQNQQELLSSSPSSFLSPVSPYSGTGSYSIDVADDINLMDGQISPTSIPGSQSSSPGSPAEMESGPSVWCMVGVQDFIITGCENGRIEMWDGKSGELRCAHDVGKDGVVGLVAEEKKVVAARVNGSLDFFEMASSSFNANTVQYRGPIRMRHNSNFVDAVASAGHIFSLQLLNTVKSAHQQPITAFKLSMGRVVTGSCDHTLKVFTIDNARCAFTLYGHKAPISALYMDQAPAAWAASGSSDGTIRLWDLALGRCLQMLDDHKAEVTSIQCSVTHIVSIAQDDKLCIWTRAGVLLHVRCLDPGCSIDMCLLGTFWCVTGGTGHVLLWDLRNGELVRKIKLTEEATGLASRVTKLVPVANLAVACDSGKELQIVCFPSVMEKVE